MPLCANPECGKEGSSRCTGCGAVSYCGRDCQKAHWKAHKGQCRAGSGSQSVSPAPKSPGPAQQEGQWRAALASALASGSHLECAQLQYQLSCAALRTGQWAEAQKQGADAVAACERALQQDPASVPGRELTVLSLVSLCLGLIELRQFEAAEVGVMRCLSEAETHFGPDHPHTVKTLRVFAMLHDRQQRFEDSCVLLQRALSGTVAHHGSRLHPEAQEVTDELVKQLLQCGRPHDALQVGQEHFDAVSSSGAASDAGLADSLVTLATVLGKSGRPDQAEQHARRALELREKTFGELAPQTAVALTVLAGILEDQGKLGPETEGLLIRASTAFQRSEGSRGSAAMVMNQLQRVRGRREEGVGGGLMRRAGECFEAKDFRQAEELLAQALDIFKAEGGEQHPSTQAASQNLGIARQNALLQLWRQVAAEEAERVRAEAEADAQAGKSQRELDAELKLIGAKEEASAGGCRSELLSMASQCPMTAAQIITLTVALAAVLRKVGADKPSDSVEAPLHAVSAALLYSEEPVPYNNSEDTVPAALALELALLHSDNPPGGDGMIHIHALLRSTDNIGALLEEKLFRTVTSPRSSSSSGVVLGRVMKLTITLLDTHLSDVTGQACARALLRVGASPLRMPNDVTVLERVHVLVTAIETWVVITTATTAESEDSPNKSSILELLGRLTMQCSSLPLVRHRLLALIHQCINS